MLESISIPQQRVVKGKLFPLCLTSNGDSKHLLSYLQNERNELDNLLREHKGILFRKCGLSDALSFHEAIEASGLEGMDYIGGAAVRTQITDRVFTANESPSTENIPFHHEMAQTPEPPTHLFFFCERAPSIGGETPILVSSELCDLVSSKHADFFTALETHGVRYVRYLPEEDDPTSAIGRGWKSTFLTESAEGAEAALRKLGSEWKWLPDGSLKTITATLPAIRVDAGDKRSNGKTFFNSIVAAFTGWNDSRNVGEKAVILADECGSPCDANIINDVAAIMDEICVAVPWQGGDMMLLDNRSVMHSRRPYTGPRRILAGLVRHHQR